MRESLSSRPFHVASNSSILNAVPRRLENENKPICLDDDSGSDDDAANQSAASSPGDIFGDYSPVSSKARSNKAVDKRNAKKAANNAVGARRAAKAKPAKPTGCRRAMPDLNEAVNKVQGDFMKQRDSFGTLLKTFAQTNSASSMSPKKRKRQEINDLKNNRQKDIDARKSTDPTYEDEIKDYTESIRRANAKLRHLETEYDNM